MELASYSYSISGVLYTALFVAVATRAPGTGASNRVLAAAAASTAVWAWCALAAVLFGRPLIALVAAAFDLSRYALWFWWTLAFLNPARRGPGAGLARTLTVVAVALITAAALLPALALSGPASTSAAAWLAPLVALALPVFGLVLAEQLYRNASDAGRWSVKPICLGLGLLFVFDVYLFSQTSLFSRVDSDALSVRAAVHGFAVPFLLVGHARQTRPEGQFLISRTMAFHSAAMVLVGGYLLFVAGVGFYVRESGGSWGGALQVGLLFVALVVLAALALSETVRAKLRVFVGKHFFSYRYDYRAEWLRFTTMLSADVAPHQVGERVIRGLADMVESPGGAVWSLGLDGDSFVQTASWNMPRSVEREALDTPFSRLLLEKDWIVDLAESRVHPHRYGDITMPQWLRELPQAWLVVPLRVAETLVGFVVLARPRTAVPINWEVRDLLKTASRQAAGFLAQMRAAEALLESRKFDAFNRMSAFVVHDLKNIVTQLSLMMKNARRLHDNPEFQQDMLATVDNALEKMRQLMVQLREGETDVAGALGVALAPIARRLAAEALQRGRTIELELVEELSTRGRGDRLERVLGHLVQNALDATTPLERVWLRLERDGGRARVVVGDDGAGMSAEFVQTRLFRPFSSTKASGMGIGAYESFQYLRELGGSIDVDSAVGRGTVISIALPLFDATQRSDLETAGAR